MNDFDKKLIAAAPKDSLHDRTFTERVMQEVRRSGDIFSRHIRTTNVKANERTFFMKLRHMPKAAVIAVAIAGLLLVSGTAYAAYQLWPQITAHTTAPQKDASGRQTTSIIGNCGSEMSGKTYELKKGAPITADQMGTVIKAQCELSAFSNWAMKKSGANNIPPGPELSSGTKRQIGMSSLATHIDTISTDSITFSALPKYNQEAITIKSTPKTLYVANNQLVSRDTFKLGDPVAYVEEDSVQNTVDPGCTSTSCSSRGSVESRTLVAVMKLDLPFWSYDQLAWQSLTELDPCQGNPADLCREGYIGGIDLYENDAAMPKPNDPAHQYKEIEGTLETFDTRSFTIKTMAGHEFTVTTPSNILGNFNSGHATLYGTTVNIGDTIWLSYQQPKTDSSHTIPQSQLLQVMLRLEMISKGDTIKKF